MDRKQYQELPHKKLSELLRRKKKENRLVSTKLAEKIGLTKSAISQILNGKMPIHPTRLPEILEFFQVSREEMSAIDPNFLEACDNPQLTSKVTFWRRADMMEITKDDLQWLLGIYEGLANPMTLSQIVGLLKLRR